MKQREKESSVREGRVMTLYDRPGTVGLTRIRQVGWDGAWNGMRC